MKNTNKSKSRLSNTRIRGLLAQSVRVLRIPAFDFLCVPTSEKVPANLVVIVPRIVGTAPVRNKIRRRFKSIFQKKCSQYGGFIWLICVRPPAAELAYIELEKQFDAAYKAAASYFSPNTQSHSLT